DSNIPPGFQNKGTLDSQCAASCTTYGCMSACQYDMHCGTKSDGSRGCVAYSAGQTATFGGAWACAGLPDITLPPVCSPDSGLRRNLPTCNRGAADLTQNVKCYSYPGNSPQFPNDDPGLGTLVLDTSSTPAPTTSSPITSASPIAAGTCRTYTIANT